MIEYIEIRAKQNRELIGIIDGANSVIWHSKYFGVGDFEIYAEATAQNIALLAEGNFVTRPNDIEVGIIEKVSYEDSVQDGFMLIATGRFAKSILDRRLIYKLSGKQNAATILRGNVESAVRTVVSNNAISCDFDSRRNIDFLELGASSEIPAIIVNSSGQAAQKQVSYGELMTYTDSVLEEYGIGATMLLNTDNGKLQYVCYVGSDKSVDNTEGNAPIIFASEFDNLSESTYEYDKSPLKTAILIGGAGEGIERFYSMIQGTPTGAERREMWLDASSINITYKDGEEEKTYTDAEYKEMLETAGKQEIAKHKITESFGGTLDVTNGVWKLNDDFFLGDIVTVQNNRIGIYGNVRITEITEVQNENGYSVDVKYQN